MMYWFPFFMFDQGHWSLSPISHTRIVGVLHLIDLFYCFTSLMIHYLSTRTVYILSAVLLLGYWVVLLVFGDQGAQLTMTGNAEFYLDKWILGEAHMYHGEGIAFEPEGFLSTLPAIVNVIIG